MRASGRGGRQGPRGDRIPPRALVAFMGDVRAACSAFRGRLLLRTGPLPRSGLYCYFTICRMILLGWPFDFRRFRHCFVK